jgi:hypothetical protein
MLTCQCCEHAQEFSSLEAAFDAGWDAPPHFTGYVSCDLCPSTVCWTRLGHPQFTASPVMRAAAERHMVQHAVWQVAGRPAKGQAP